MNTHPANLLILGSGHFGTALAQHLSRLSHRVTLWCRSKKTAAYINEHHQHPDYLKSFALHQGIQATHLREFPQPLEGIIVAVPTPYLRRELEQWPMPPPSCTLISAVKGIEQDTLKLPHELIGTVFSKERAKDLVCLSGPSFALEIMAGQPTAVVVASLNSQEAKRAQTWFHCPTFRCYTSDDPVGVEVAGAVKNVLAIATGACIGLGYEQNATAALITRGLAEMTRLGVALGAKPLTFIGLSGVGDLFLTCNSEKSRNYRVGMHLAEGDSLSLITEKIGSVAEGITTAKALMQLATQKKVDMPICRAVYEVLYEGKKPAQVVDSLLTRLPKKEH